MMRVDAPDLRHSRTTSLLLDQLNQRKLPRFVRGLAELASDYDILLCDVWGVLHDGMNVFRAAIEALCHFRGTGGRVVLVTNAPTPGRIVKDQLASLGVPRDAYDFLVSSGDVTVSLLLSRGDAGIYPLGCFEGTDLFDEVCRSGGRKPRLTPIESADFVLCTAFFDPDRESAQDYDPLLAKILALRLDMICANPDIVVQQGNKLYYCAGAIAERYAAAGGSVVMAGKPFAPIYSAAFSLLAEGDAQIDRSRVLVIGDAMRTDIRGAHSQNLASLFVTTGIHRAELHADSGAGELDAAAYRQFLEAADFAPTASIAELAW